MRHALLAMLIVPGLALAQAESQPAKTIPPDEVLLDDRDAAPREDVPIPEKILLPPPPEAAPTVSIRTDGEDVVEEYRQNGRIYMVKVRPPRGTPYTLMDSNGDGRLDTHDGDGPVAPVYYTLYEWD